MRLKGDFQVSDAHFTNDKIQKDVDDLSLRGQGKATLAKAGVHNKVPSNLQGMFNLKEGVLSFSDLHFQVPGANVEMTGEYGLGGKT
ncbi:MAG: hypothetical protein WA172_03190, partial [Terriglobales bacterium]